MEVGHSERQSQHIAVSSSDVDECASNPCKNEATCVDAPGSYSCTCAPGYTDGNCSTGEAGRGGAGQGRAGQGAFTVSITSVMVSHFN